MDQGFSRLQPGRVTQLCTHFTLSTGHRASGLCEPRTLSCVHPGGEAVPKLGIVAAQDKRKAAHFRFRESILWFSQKESSVYCYKRNKTLMSIFQK